MATPGDIIMKMILQDGSFLFQISSPIIKTPRGFSQWSNFILTQPMVTYQAILSLTQQKLTTLT
jgi:hypothetical protein